VKKLSYSNVLSTLALVVAVGTGGAFAASQIDGSTLKDRSVGGGKLKNDTVKSKQVKESTLKGLFHGKTGRTTATGTNSGADQGEVRSLRTPIGRFRLACGIAAADARYYNNTPGVADVFLSIVGSGSDTGTVHNTLSSPGDIGFGADETTGAELVELRVSKGSRVAIFRAGEAREGTRCNWNWELVSSG
jgi:hypothetical protein